MQPNVRAVIGGVVHLTVEDIAQALTQYTKIVVVEDTDEGGAFGTETGSVALASGTTGYAVFDEDGSGSVYYKARFSNADGSVVSDYSSVRQGGTQEAYCTALDIRAELASGSGNVTVGQAHANNVWDMIVEASRLIDEYKRVEHGAYDADDSETRYFAGSGVAVQQIDPTVSVTTLKVEETDGTYTTWTENTDFYTWPYNASAIGEPIRRLEVVDKTGTTKSVFTLGAKRVEVTGVFGISSAPPDTVKRAAKIQAARWYKRAQQAWQDSGVSADSGQMQYVRALDPDVKTLLKGIFPHMGAGI